MFVLVSARGVGEGGGAETHSDIHPTSSSSSMLLWSECTLLCVQQAWVFAKHLKLAAFRLEPLLLLGCLWMWLIVRCCDVRLAALYACFVHALQRFGCCLGLCVLVTSAVVLGY